MLVIVFTGDLPAFTDVSVAQSTVADRGRFPTEFTNQLQNFSGIHRNFQLSKHYYSLRPTSI